MDKNKIVKVRQYDYDENAWSGDRTCFQTRDYVDGIEYNGGTLEFIHTPVGRIIPSGATYEYQYFIRDHLANNRVGFSQGTNVSTPNFSADYYPFGLRYPEIVRTGLPENHYLYNGKEWQDGLRMLDYGARLMDPLIARWNVPDPMAESYYSLTPYQYGGNTPVNTIDVGGNLFIFVAGFQPNHWLLTKLPTQVPNQYGTTSPNANYASSISMDRGFSTSDKSGYWGSGSLIDTYNLAYQDEHNLFVNSSYTPRSSASVRYKEGMIAGQNLIDQLESGFINLSEGETIKLVGHSQGAAYAAGIATLLAKHEKYGSVLEFVDYISPHQPGNFRHPKDIKGRQFSTKSDQVSSKNNWFYGGSKYGKIEGAKWGIERDEYKGGFGGHSVGTWLNDMIDYWRDLGIPVKIRDQ